MANGYSKQIQEQIKAAAEGTIFISSDFADNCRYGNHKTELKPAYTGRYASPHFERCL